MRRWRKKSEHREILMRILKEDRRDHANEMRGQYHYQTSYYRDHAFGATSAAFRFGIITVEEFNTLRNWITEIWMRKVAQ